MDPGEAEHWDDWQTTGGGRTFDLTRSSGWQTIDVILTVGCVYVELIERLWLSRVQFVV